MKVLLDESTPRRLASSFPGSFEIHTENVADLPIPVVVMIARRTRLQELRPLVPEVIAVISGDLERRIYRVVA